MKSQEWKGSRGGSFVEVLVALAMVAIVAAMLFPVLAGLRANADTSSVNAAMTSYTEEYTNLFLSDTSYAEYSVVDNRTDPVNCRDLTTSAISDRTNSTAALSDSWFLGERTKGIGRHALHLRGSITNQATGKTIDGTESGSTATLVDALCGDTTGGSAICTDRSQKGSQLAYTVKAYLDDKTDPSYQLKVVSQACMGDAA